MYKQFLSDIFLKCGTYSGIPIFRTFKENENNNNDDDDDDDN